MPRISQQRRLKIAAFSPAIGGIIVWSLAAWRWGASDYGSLALVLLVAGFMTLSGIFRFQIALKQEMAFDLPVLVIATVLINPTWAAPLVTAGYLLGYAIRFRYLDIDAPFNFGVYAITVSLGGIGLGVLDWNWAATHPIPELLLAGLAMAALGLIVQRSMDAWIVHIQSGLPFRQILRDATLGMQEAEQAMLGAMVAMGLIGLILAAEDPWLLLLLSVPAFALWHALRQHIATRHRIEASLETAQRVALIGTLDWDLKSNDMRWTDILFQILDYDPASTSPSFETYLARVAPSDKSTVASSFVQARTGGEHQLEHRIELPTGEHRALDVTFSNVYDRHHRVKRTVATVHDITDRKLLEQRLEFQAYHDPLTHLSNRAMFLNRLDQSFARYSRDSSIALLFLDLDRFKLINDTLGHDAGDHLLRTVARRLERCIRPNDLVARLGGDEFIVLLDAVHNDQEAIQVAERILREMEPPVPYQGGRDMRISTSIGIVRPLPEHHNASDFLRDADTALYFAKEHGRGRYAVFSSNMSEGNRNRLDLEEDIRLAFERGEFSVVYQPRYHLGTGRTAAMEALVRWSQPSRGVVPPLQFIPIIEDLGLAEQLLDVTLMLVLDDLAAWSRLPGPVPPVSLNLTPRQVLNDSLPERIRTHLSSRGLSPDSLRIEVPESAITENEAMIIRVLGDLRIAGIRSSIDDFGTGHASLAALSRLPIDIVQLDQSLVGELEQSESARTIAGAVIGMAHGLHLAVTAEGIETRGQLGLLRALECDFGQGHLFAAATAIDDPAALAEADAAVLAMLGQDVVLGESVPKGRSDIDS